MKLKIIYGGSNDNGGTKESAQATNEKISEQNIPDNEKTSNQDIQNVKTIFSKKLDYYAPYAKKNS